MKSFDPPEKNPGYATDEACDNPISNDRVASPTDKNNDKVDSRQAKECAKSSWGGPPGLPFKIKSEKI